MTDGELERAVAGRIEQVRARIQRAARAGGRTDDVRLVAVSKTHSPRAIRAAVASGVTDVAENRVAEVTAKLDLLAGAQAPADMAHVGWHFIGQVQSRKASHLVGRDLLVHSVDRRSLVDRIERLAARRGVLQRILVQVNVAGESGKGGCSLREVDELVAYALDQPHVVVSGLMTIPPLQDSADGTAGRWFAELARARDRLVQRWPDVHELSMGMSADLEQAVQHGATMVRVGTDVFGPRKTGPWRPGRDT